MSIYDDLIDIFEIKKGDLVWLSSNIITISLIFKRMKMKFDGDIFLDILQKRIGHEGTILIPVFNWNLKFSETFDVLKTKGTTGALGNIAIIREDFCRTQHPMHSFMVWGKDKEYLCGLSNVYNFGKDSPFEYCKENNVKQIMLGTDFAHAMTFIHYVEVMCKVPYRYEKEFVISYRDRDGVIQNRSFGYYPKTREFNSIERFNRMGDILLQNGIAKKASFYECESYFVHLGDSYELIKYDIINNKCRNLFDFSIERDQVFIGGI